MILIPLLVLITIREFQIIILRKFTLEWNAQSTLVQGVCVKSLHLDYKAL